MSVGVAKLILLFAIENDAIFIDKAHDRRFPTRGSQKVDDDVEEPILLSLVKSALTFSVSKGLSLIIN